MDPATLPEGNDTENDEPDDDPQESVSVEPSTAEVSTKPPTSTFSRTISSVSVTSTAISSTASSTQVCSSSGATCACPTYSFYDAEITAAADENTEATLKRRLHAKSLVKRAKNTSDKVAGRQCSVRKYQVRPDYPGPIDVSQNEANQGAGSQPDMMAFYKTAKYWAIPTQRASCDPPEWAFVDTEKVVNQHKYKIGGGKGRSVNIDHAFEIKLLDEFLKAQVDGGFSCEDIITLFDQIDAETEGKTRLYRLFAQLPSYTNPEFIGMDYGLNQLKGKLWNPGLSGVKLSKDLGSLQGVLVNLGITVSIIQHTDTFTLWQSTNNRIYNAFRGIDTLISEQASCGEPLKKKSGEEMQATWAAAYVSWIKAKISSQNDLISSTASELRAALPTNMAMAQGLGLNIKEQTVEKYRVWLEKFDQIYPVMTLPAPGEYSEYEVKMRKRTDSCPLTQPASEFTSAPPQTTTSGDISSVPSRTTNKPTATHSVTQLITSSAIPTSASSSSQSMPTTTTPSALTRCTLRDGDEGPFCDCVDPESHRPARPGDTCDGLVVPYPSSCEWIVSPLLPLSHHKNTTSRDIRGTGMESCNLDNHV